jgi:hypothetical protein
MASHQSKIGMAFGRQQQMGDFVRRPLSRVTIWLEFEGISSGHRR